MTKPFEKFRCEGTLPNSKNTRFKDEALSSNLYIYLFHSLIMMDASFETDKSSSNAEDESINGYLSGEKRPRKGERRVIDDYLGRFR
jgi:hypothetical protein